MPCFLWFILDSSIEIMEPWFIPTITALSLAFCVFVAFCVFLYQRAKAKHAGTENLKRPWGSTLEETTLHLTKEQMLDRFILFSLNLTSLLWSSEHSIVHTDRALVNFRRGLNILAIFIGLFTFGIADVIYLNWSCYSSSSSIDDYNQGLCSNPNSEINQGENIFEIVGSYHAMSTWIWVSNAIFGGALFLSLLIHAYLAFNFVDRVRYGVEGSYTGMIDMIDDHKHLNKSEEETTLLKQSAWHLFHSHVNKEDDQSQAFVPHEINLHRLGILFFDPFAILFGFPHIVLSRSDLAIANMFLIWCMIGTWNLYFHWALPRYHETCCHYDDATRAGHAGLCNNPNDPIAFDPFRLSCNGYNLELTIIIWTGVAELGTIVLFWLYSTILFQFIVSKNTRSTLLGLKQVATTRTDLIKSSTEENPPPPYKMEPPPPYKKN